MISPAPFDFAHLFDADEYLYFMEETLRDENTKAQVDFMCRVLDASEPKRFVDLGCGHGRHANELARRGHEVLGVDLVEGFLARARDEATKEGLSAEFLQCDMASFPISPQFDRAICMFDAFGFFDDMHQLSTLRTTHAALRDGGRFLLDLRMREWMLRAPPASVLEKGNGDLMIDRHSFDVITSRFVDRRTYIRGGKQRDISFSVRLWAFTEIRLVLGSVGFEVEAVFGDFEGGEISVAKPRMLLACKKVAPPTA